MASSLMCLMWELMNKYPLEMVSDDGPYKCSVCGKLMVDAHISRCSCQFCKACLTGYMADGHTSCPGSNSECRSLPLDIFPDNSANIKIFKLEVVCPTRNCDSVVELGKLAEHLRLCEEVCDTCPFERIGCDGGDQNGTSDHMNVNNLVHLKLLVDTIETLRDELTFVKKELQGTKEELANLKRCVEDITAKNNCGETQRRNHRSREEQSGSIDRDRHRQNVGEILWTFGGFSHKTEMAIQKKKLCENGPPFLSHNRGYTFCLVVYPYGCADGKGEYLYVGFKIMKGYFDEFLDWPFRGSITISLVDQISGKDKFVKVYNYDSVSDECKYLLDKPVLWRNHGWGDLHFVKLEKLKSMPTILMEDSLLIRCKVDYPMA